MSVETWNEICFILSENITKEISEEEFEKYVIQALRVLGWKQYLDDFDIRPSFQIGSGNRITPDFVVKSKTKRKLFVIEIKQPHLPITNSFQKQLFSYMRQLKMKYGLLIGQSIQIFYDGDNIQQDDPILLETIKFERDSERGKKFVKLFSKESINYGSLEEFANEVIEKINRKKLIKTLTAKILSDNFKDNLFKLIKQEFINEYDGELIDSALENIQINISKRIETSEIATVENRNKPNFSKASLKHGVISSIVNLISDGPKSHEEILSGLIKLFPERSAKSMMNTIKAQLGGTNPLRIERERNISVKIIIDSKKVKRYTLVEQFPFNNNKLDNNRIIESHIFKTFGKSIEEFTQFLAEKYISDQNEKKIFLKNNVWLKVRLNYIAGLILTSQGKKIFSPKDIRNIIREKIIPSLSEISDDQLSSILLTSDVHRDAKELKYHNGFPCLKKVSRGKYRFIGFSK